jgi:hypothetical protein
MRRVGDLRKWSLAIALVSGTGLAWGAVAQVSEILPVIDAYYKSLTNFEFGCRPKKPTKPVIL